MDETFYYIWGDPNELDAVEAMAYRNWLAAYNMDDSEYKKHYYNYIHNTNMVTALSYDCVMPMRRWTVGECCKCCD